MLVQLSMLLLQGKAEEAAPPHKHTDKNTNLKTFHKCRLGLIFTFRQKRNVFLSVPLQSVWPFLDVPAKKECSYCFLETRFLGIPWNSMDSCRNAQLSANRWVYVNIQKGMYGLPQADLVNKLLKKCLAVRGYYQCHHTPGLWGYIWHDITFCLIVDNFGIKTNSMANMKYLVSSLQEHYSIAVGWTGSLFYRVKLTLDFIN
jgi:hypothetical protein